METLKMSNKTPWIAAAALAAAGLLATGAAQARSDVQWSISIGVPGVAVVPGYPAYPVYGAPVYHAPAPVYGVPVYRPYPVYRPVPVYRGHPHSTHWYGDRDHDGVPNHRDRYDNRSWDRDGDGIPNRRDPRYDPRGDRDRDGIPNYRDRNDRSDDRWRR
jgi:hypothetical protein